MINRDSIQTTQMRQVYMNITKPYISFQVSETENLRKNLAVERMIVEGCDILLDVNQVFVRQGRLLGSWFCLSASMFIVNYLHPHLILFSLFGILKRFSHFFDLNSRQ